MNASFRPSRSAALRLLAAFILAASLGLASWVYLTAHDGPGEDAVYVDDGGGAYATSRWDSRAYIRSLELYGGKMDVLLAQFREWLGGVFRGTPLAVLIGCLGLAGAGLCLRLADAAGERPGGKGGT